MTRVRHALAEALTLDTTYAEDLIKSSSETVDRRRRPAIVDVYMRPSVVAARKVTR